jgi:prepilin-type N-terminal cleavage/methylation domain-containing protein
MERKANKYGLTLVEILVAVVIMAILTAGLYSVSHYLETQAKIKLTKSTIELLCSALERYHDFYGKFPDPNADIEYPDPDKCNGIERLYYKLTLAPNAKKVLNQISSSLIKDADIDEFPKVYPEIVDAWGRNFKYEYSKTNKDNFPVITSAGNDGLYGTGDDICNFEPNVPGK